MPMPKHQGGIVAEKAKFEAGKIELAHCGAIGIIFLVAGRHAVPPARDSSASGKRQIRRMPVALQKRVHIALVPIVLLRLENFRNRRAVVLMFVGGSAKFGNLCDPSKKR